MDEDYRDNRDRKIEGRRKQRRHVQGTRAFLHAVTNRVAKQAPEDDPQEKSPSRR